MSSGNEMVSRIGVDLGPKYRTPSSAPALRRVVGLIGLVGATNAPPKGQPSSPIRNVTLLTLKKEEGNTG